MGDELKATSVHFGETGVTQSWEGSKFSPVLYIMDFTYPPHACFIAGTPWVFFFFLANPITQGWIQPEVVVDQAWTYHPGVPKQVFASSMHEKDELSYQILHPTLF
jgi:hypothetical protein